MQQGHEGRKIFCSRTKTSSTRVSRGTTPRRSARPSAQHCSIRAVASPDLGNSPMSPEASLKPWTDGDSSPPTERSRRRGHSNPHSAPVCPLLWIRKDVGREDISQQSAVTWSTFEASDSYTVPVSHEASGSYTVPVSYKWRDSDVHAIYPDNKRANRGELQPRDKQTAQTVQGFEGRMCAYIA